VTFDKLDSLLAQRAPQSQRKPAVGSRPQVLVVDDDAGIRSSLSMLLGDKYDVQLSVSAVDALRMVHDDICCVVLDVKMKGQDGFWACDRIRDRYPHLPVIFYSAFQDAKDPYRIINEHRPFAYLTKGGNPKELVNALEVAVRLYSLLLQSKRLTQSQAFEKEKEPVSSRSPERVPPSAKGPPKGPASSR